MLPAHVILYVRDQRRSARFYEELLLARPRLDVPGMTEFEIGAECVLGIMPEAGARRLLGDAVPDPSSASGVPRAELYLHVDDPAAWIARAVAAGARLVSPVGPRDWGDDAGYCADADGHVLAFARRA